MSALRRSVFMGLGFLALAISTTAVTGASSGTVTLTLPEGDPVEGRAAFQALSCTSCHRVSGETDFPDPVSATPGPTLGRYHARQDPARLGMSIFAPSHEITATVRGQREDNLSPMPDFTKVMTVRQFMDLVAYLRSLDDEK